MNKFKVSIIIPTYNRANLLRKTLSSIVMQDTEKESIEVIVCDDGSSDNTKEVANEFKSLLNIEYLYQEDKGFRAGSARNMGIKCARGELCVFIDTGILLSSNTVSNYIKIYEYDKDSVIIGSVLGFDNLNANEEIINKYINLSDTDKIIKKLNRLNVRDSREIYYERYGDDLSRWKAPWVVFWTCNVGVSKSKLLKVGLFDEYYNTWGGEDTDLGIALFKSKGNFILSRECLGVDMPHKKYLLETSSEEFTKNHLEKLAYMYKKYDDYATKIAVYYDYWYLNELLEID